MRFKEYLEEAPKKGFPEKFIGKILTAKQNVFQIDPDEIPSEGGFFSEKDLKAEFLWLKKGFKTELKDSEASFGTFVMSSDGKHDFSEEDLDRLLNGRLITIK